MIVLLKLSYFYTKQDIYNISLFKFFLGLGSKEIRGVTRDFECTLENPEQQFPKTRSKFFAQNLIYNGSTIGKP